MCMLACAVVAACGTPGAPMPPELELARPVTDLRAARKGDKVYLAWTVMVFPPLEDWDPRLWIPINALLLVALMISLQAVVWTLHRFPFIRGSAVFVIVSIFAVLFFRVINLSKHPLGWLRWGSG